MACRQIDPVSLSIENACDFGLSTQSMTKIIINMDLRVGSINSATTVLRYKPSDPPIKSGVHGYMILIYRHNKSRTIIKKNFRYTTIKLVVRETYLTQQNTQLFRYNKIKLIKQRPIGKQLRSIIDIIYLLALLLFLGGFLWRSTTFPAINS